MRAAIKADSLPKPFGDFPEISNANCRKNWS